MDKLLKKSAVGLAKLIREGSVSSTEVLEAYIEQIKRVNPALNAVVAERFDLALQEAQKIDEQIKAGLDKEPPPLLGVPCTIKEMIKLEGMPHSLGLVQRKDVIADEDATTVQRLKEAGAIPLGITNIPVIGLHYESRNYVYGQTNNPHNLSYTAGGSSGGEGAIISAGGSPFGLGSDLGGSTRIPASFCGIFGHKTSAGLVPFWGHEPYPTDVRARRCSSIGPLARHSEDLMPILRILAGPDGRDDSVEKLKLGDPEKVKIKDLTFYYINHKDLHEDVAAAQNKTIETLKEMGATVQEIDLGKFKHSYDMFTGTLHVILSEAIESLGNGKRFQPTLEALKAMVNQSNYPWYAILVGYIMVLTDALGHKRSAKFFEMTEAFRLEFHEMLGPKGVLIYPTHPYPAVKHGRGLIHIMRLGFTAIFNMLHCPATSFPMGLSRGGLPIGIQAVAQKGNDHLTIAVAQAMESKGNTWIIPELAK